MESFGAVQDGSLMSKMLVWMRFLWMERKLLKKKVSPEEVYISSREGEEGVMITYGGQGTPKKRVMLM